MNTVDELDARWHQLSDDVITGMKDWRLQHPQATFQAIECTLDERLARLRARMLPDAALLSRATDLSALPTDERPVCPPCGARMASRGQQSRALTTNHEQTIELQRSYAVCPQCQTGFFPPR